MGRPIVLAGANELASVVADRPGSTLVVGLRRHDGGLRSGPGAVAASRLLGVDLVALASAALPPTALAAADPTADRSPFATAVLVLPGAGGSPAGSPGGGARRVVVCALGDGAGPDGQAPDGQAPDGQAPDGQAPDAETVFGAALATARTAGGAIVSLLGLDLPDAAAIGLAAQGHRAGLWRYRPAEVAADGAGPSTPELVVVTDQEGARRPAVAAALERARIVADAVDWVRTVVETPPNLLGPRAFADAITAFAAGTAGDAVAVEVWDAAGLADRGFGGTLGVGAGSARPPLAVELRVAGTGPTTALAGKGITFDSGGVNLKRDPGEIAWMKSDMAAAASVAAAVIAAAALGAAGPLHAVLPIAENMPGGGAQRPGDVVRHPGGRTTEVVDTDSEGRLVLADALAWLARDRPARLIDVGTLTDSGAVGTAFWGCWGTSSALADALIAAGRAAADPGWLLPLHPSYTDLLSSRVADIANCAVDVPDTGQLAATYLRTFIGDVPWVHIDNGSSAWLERDAAPWPAGPTAAPLRAVIELLRPTDA
ncbi:leucyl aminopeptidase family protein [Leifsonia aquatica]|uniref:leucyl aminopeptidase family protein n=1 Tax=Leifsonia aquatica TaxID=144185 RepID=UPI00046A87B6|nr:M17 family metallopeptidase [Leifsonia aquatica]